MKESWESVITKMREFLQLPMLSEEAQPRSLALKKNGKHRDLDFAKAIPALPVGRC